MSKKVMVLYRDADRVPAYCDALTAAGLVPQIVEAGAAFSLDHCGGILLMGGQDVDPALYGEPKHEKTDYPDAALDRAELEAVDEALERDIPLFAICRGMQLLNVHHKGALFQHLTPVERHRRIQNGDRSLPVHSVTIEDGTLLGRIAGTRSWGVNSRHHQAVKTLGKDLRVSAMDSQDGGIEAIERADRTFVLGVQWHPEDQIYRDPEQLKLFQRFGDALGR